LNILLPSQYLAQKTELSGYSNLILLSDRKANRYTITEINKMVKNNLLPEDTGIIVNKII